MPIPEPRKISVSEARAQWADLLDAIAEGDGLRVIVERHGKPLAILLHPEEVQVLDRIEDRFVQNEVDRMRAAGDLDDGTRFSTEEVMRGLAEDRAKEDLERAIERTSERRTQPGMFGPLRKVRWPTKSNVKSEIIGLKMGRSQLARAVAKKTGSVLGQRSAYGARAKASKKK